MILAGAEDDKKMPLLDHLVELRKRLLYSFAGLIIAFGICFFFAQHIFNFLAQPLADRAKKKGLAGDYASQASKIFAEKVTPALSRQIALMSELRPKAADAVSAFKGCRSSSLPTVALRRSI